MCRNVLMLICWLCTDSRISDGDGHYLLFFCVDIIELQSRPYRSSGGGKDLLPGMKKQFIV